MSALGSFPHLKKKLLKLIEDDIAWQEEDCKRHRRIKAELEKL
jgi:hypothetical protein